MTVFLLAAVLAAGAHAPPPTAPAPSASHATEWVATLAALGAAGALDRWVQPSACRWCDRDAEGHDTLNGFDRSARSALRWSDAHLATADVLSYVTEYAPVSLLFLHRDAATPTRALVAVESLAATDLIAGGLKLAFARERPSVHFAGDAPTVSAPRDANKSFPSGHASGVSALVFAMARTCRIEHCPYERSIWWVGGSLTLTTMWLRIAADQHYMTDVLAGAGLGASIGWWLPQLRQRTRRGPSVSPAVGRHSRGVSVRYDW